MIKVLEIYEDCRDVINTDENGNFSYRRSNRMSWVGQMTAIDILTGKLSGLSIPTNYVTQKSKDILTPLIKTFQGNITNGTMPKPTDYYTYDTMYLIGSSNDVVNCETEFISGINTPVQILDSAQYDFRANTDIEELKPSISEPICKLEGNQFYFLPRDLGTVNLVYIKIPVKAEIKIIINQQTNNEEPDLVNSIDYEWDESARNLLVYCIVQAFSVWNREQLLSQQNQMKGQNMLGT